MSYRKPSCHRFPLSIIGDALRWSHRFPLNQRDWQELLHEYSVQVSHETLRPWNIKFAPLLSEALRHQEGTPRFPVVFGRDVRGSRWGQALAVAGSG